MIRDARAAAAHTSGACIGTWWFRQRERGSVPGVTCLVSRSCPTPRCGSLRPGPSRNGCTPLARSPLTCDRFHDHLRLTRSPSIWLRRRRVLANFWTRWKLAKRYSLPVAARPWHTCLPSSAPRNRCPSGNWPGFARPCLGCGGPPPSCCARPGMSGCETGSRAMTFDGWVVAEAKGVVRPLLSVPDKNSPVAEHVRNMTSLEFPASRSSPVDLCGETSPRAPRHPSIRLPLVVGRGVDGRHLPSPALPAPT